MAGRKKAEPGKLKKHRTAPKLLSDDDLVGFDDIEMGLRFLNSVSHQAIDEALKIKNKLQDMLVSQSKVDSFIREWRSASKAEIKSRLTTLGKKNKTAQVQAEIKALKALL